MVRVSRQRQRLSKCLETVSHECSQRRSAFLLSAIEEARAFIDKSERSLDAAATLLKAGHQDFAASRVHYGCFYVAEALLLTERLSFSLHSAVIAAYGRLFAKTERLDRRYHRLLERTFDARQSADYEAEVDLNPTEVAGWI